MAQSVYLMGATYQDVPSVVLPTDNQGGTASFYDARTVTYNLSGGATVSANPTNAIAGQGFSLKLTVPTGYVLSGVTVTMGGNDITSQVFTPDEEGGGGETLLGTTPYTLLESANIKLVGSGSFTYSYTDIVDDFDDRTNVSGSYATLTDEGSYYQLVNNGASVWYSANKTMNFGGLVQGQTYTLTVVGAGDGTNSGSGYWIIYDSDGETILGTIVAVSGTNTLNITPSGTQILVVIAVAASSQWDSGIRTAKWTSMTISQSISDSATGTASLGVLNAGTTITASPAVQVYSITGGGGGSATLITKSITANGTYDAEDDSADGYSSVTVNVPNTYASGDNGKVVSNGALVAQGSDTVTQNGTVDTTLISSLLVNVTGTSPVKTATGTFTGNGTRQVTISCDFEPDLIYWTSDPGTTASSGTVAGIIAREMMSANRYRNNATTNSHYAAIDITAMNTSGSSYSFRATYENSTVTLYCFNNNARSLFTNGRTYTYKFVKWTT